MFTITLDVDHAIHWGYAAIYKSRLPVGLCSYSKIILKLQAANRIQHLITLQVSDIEYELVRR